jgi:hypothetical protein
MTDDTCDAVKNDGDPCEYAAKYDDGKCGIHTDKNPRQDPGGRPSLLEEYEDDIMVGARQGMTLEGCARLAGVAEKTLHSWINNNEEFRKSLKRARAQGELKRLQTVNESGSRFILERSFGYTKTEKRELEHSGEVAGSLFELPPEVTDNWTDGDE